MDLILQSERLILRPLRQDDAGAIQVQCNNWKVARMTARIPHPYPDGLAERWIAEHDETRAAGTEYPFGIEHEAILIGVVGLDREDSGPFELGYWIGEPWWGQGFATEAAKRAAAFAFDDLGAEELTSGHFLDNPASGRVLDHCGFRYSGDKTLWCAARGQEVEARHLVLRRDWFAEQAAGQ